jgi:hypothetical protein
MGLRTDAMPVRPRARRRRARMIKTVGRTLCKPIRPRPVTLAAAASDTGRAGAPDWHAQSAQRKHNYNSTATSRPGPLHRLVEGQRFIAVRRLWGGGGGEQRARPHICRPRHGLASARAGRQRPAAVRLQLQLLVLQHGERGQEGASLSSAAPQAAGVAPAGMLRAGQRGSWPACPAWRVQAFNEQLCMVSCLTSGCGYQARRRVRVRTRRRPTVWRLPMRAWSLAAARRPFGANPGPAPRPGQPGGTSPGPMRAVGRRARCRVHNTRGGPQVTWFARGCGESRAIKTRALYQATSAFDYSNGHAARQAPRTHRASRRRVARAAPSARGKPVGTRPPAEPPVRRHASLWRLSN